MTQHTVLLWLRRDLRLSDNPALQAALDQDPQSVVPVFIHSPQEEGDAAPGAASQWWLHQSLLALERELVKRGSRLVIRRGPALAALQTLCEETGATTVHWNRRYEPACVQRDEHVKTQLKALGVAPHSFNSALLFEPWSVATTAGKPYTVFTPFWRACLAQPSPPPPTPAPKRIPAPQSWPESLGIDDLALMPTINWWQGMADSWQPGEQGAQQRLRKFVDHALSNYTSDRNRPDKNGVSRLSPHLHFGELSPRQAFHATMQATLEEQALPEIAAFQRELGWREFAHHLLFYFPHTVQQPLNQNFSQFPWATDDKGLQAWQRGKTGYPLVDAGMRELWHTGFMHNRVRMVVASFLVKHLLLPWQKGASWFWDTLVDADLANNTLGWQWTAGCGADAAPFFRIFNPVLQGQKFDPKGHYVRLWVPELAKLPDAYLHAPWTSPASVLAKAKVALGKTYPGPIVDHGFARQRALHALAETKQARTPLKDQAPA